MCNSDVVHRWSNAVALATDGGSGKGKGRLRFDCIVLVIYSHIRSSAEPGADESVTSDEEISEEIRENVKKKKGKRSRGERGYIKDHAGCRSST